jgi:hypothetical protein
MYIKYYTLTLYYFVSSRVATSLRFSRRYIPPLTRRDSAPLGQSRQIIPRIGEDDRAVRNTGAAAEVCSEARSVSIAGGECCEAEIMRSCSPLRGGWQSIIV